MSKDMIRTIWTGTIVTSIGTVFVKFVGIGATFLTLHQLTVYEYGLTELAISAVPLLSIFLFPGLANIIIAEMGIAKKEGKMGKAKALFADFFRHQLIGAIFGWAVVFFGAEILNQIYNQHIADLFRIASFSFLLGPFRTNFLAALRVDFRFKTISAFGVVEECIKILVLAYCFFILGFTTKGVLLASLLNEAIALLLFSPVFFSLYRSWGDPENSVRFPFHKVFAEHGKWGMMTYYLSNFSGNIRIWIIKLFLGADAVGLFSLASGLYSNVVSLLQMSNIVAPIIPQYTHDSARFDKLITKSIKYQFLGHLVSLIAAIVIFPTLTAYVFPKFTPALSLFYALLPTIGFNSISSILSPVFSVIRAQRGLFFSSLFKLASILIFAPLFLWLFGIFGVCAEFFVTTAIFTIERYRSLQKKLPWFHFDFKNFLVIDQDDRAILRNIPIFSMFFSK